MSLPAIATDNLTDPAVFERRKPVWIAISDLCLDTDVDDYIPEIVRIIQAQGFTAEEASYIAFYEVFPVVYTNLFAVAGAWAGFDREWLAGRILARRRGAFSRIQIRLMQRIYRMTLDEDWQKVERHLRG